MPNKTKTANKTIDGRTPNMPKREFAFSHEFPNEITLALKAYDRVFKELTSISSGKLPVEDEYGICNNLYKFRYITPSDIATFTSNLIKVLHSQMIHPQVTDLEKFAVMSVKQFMIDHSCVPIEHSSIYALYHYTTDNMTLKDLLLLCENDFYHKTVVSKVEMQERVKVIKDDYKKIADMHFSTNIQKIVESLPSLMNQTEFNSLPYVQQKAIQMYVEEFILFTIMLNTVVMSNMIFFCVPKSTFNSKLIKAKPEYNDNTLFPDDNIDDGVEDNTVTESVQPEGMKDIYIVLVEGPSPISNMIKKHTMSRFSHVGLSFDVNLHKTYSFGKNNPKNDDTKSRDGFRMDDMGSDHYKGLSFTVYGAFVTDAQYNKMKKFADEVKNSPKTKYSSSKIIDQFFNNDKINKNAKSTNQICSTFVNDILKAADIKVTEKNNPAPGDFEHSLMTKMNMFEHVFSGTYDEYDVDDVKDRMETFSKRGQSQVLHKKDKGTVVTECCLLKTNNMRCHSKIPFDINMRNIVLQDMHPHFKDTISAITYITTDMRSPIAQLLYRYGHPSEVLNGLDGMMICKMFLNGPCGMCNDYDEVNMKLRDVDFHTDVNWLDKIAYGNNFLDGNYRGEDAVGNDHRHPIRQTLDALYRMFSEKDLTTKEELSDHIIKISHIMKTVCESYASYGLRNWEMVRDILVVLGEIMTRAMIKLYSNHMTIILASDNMDDVDAPGYMYTESFEEYLMMEGGEGQQTQQTQTSSSAPAKVDVSSENGNAQNNNNGQNDPKKESSELAKRIKTLLKNFSNWVKKSLGNMAARFSTSMEAQLKYINDNGQQNLAIAQAVKSGKFQLKLENKMQFNVNLDGIKKIQLRDFVKAYVDGDKATAEFNPLEFKREFYKNISPSFDDSVITEYAIMEADDGSNSNNNNGKDNKQSATAKAVRNFVLSGDPKKEPESKEFDFSGQNGETAWNEMIRDMLDTPKLLREVQKALTLDLTDATNLLNTDLDHESKAEQPDPAKTKRIETISASVTKIASECHTAVVNAINEMFRINYTCYKNIVEAYNNQNSKQNTQQTQQQQTQQTQQQPQSSTNAEQTKAAAEGTAKGVMDAVQQNASPNNNQS